MNSNHLMRCTLALLLMWPLMGRAFEFTEHVAVTLQGAKDPLGLVYGSNIKPIGVSVDGQTVTYPHELSASTTRLYLITPQISAGVVGNKITAPRGGTFKSFVRVDSHPIGALAMSVTTSAAPSAMIVTLTGNDKIENAAAGTSAAGDGNFIVGGFDTTPSLNDFGRVAFIASTSSTTSPRGVFLATPSVGTTSTVERVVRIGDNSFDGGTFIGFEGDAVLNSPSSGPAQVAFYAQTNGSIGYGLFIGSPSTLRLVKAGLRPGVFGNEFGFNDAGQITFKHGNDLYLGTSASNAVVVANNTTLPSGETLTGLGKPWLNNLGEIVFSALATPSGGTAKTAIFKRSSAGVISRLAIQNQVLDPMTLSYSPLIVETDTVETLGEPQINDRGAVLIPARYRKSVATTTTSTATVQTTEYGLLISDGLTLTKLVGTGDKAPDNSTFIPDSGSSGPIGPEIIPAKSLPGHAGFNNNGHVLYRAPLANNKYGTFISVPATHWRATATGSWFNPSNWTFDHVPTSQSNVILDPPSTVTITLPINGTSLRRLIVGNGPIGIRLEMQDSSVLQTTYDTTILPGSWLSGNGDFIGDLTIGGIHERDISAAQTVTGTLTYGTNGIFSIAISGNTSSATLPVVANRVKLEDDSKIAIKFDAPGSTADFSHPFWDNIQSWPLFTANSITGDIEGGFFTNDSTGTPLSSAIGQFSFTRNGNTYFLVWVPHQTQPAVTAPAAQLFALGSNASLTTTGTGNALSYVWKKNGTPLGNSNSATLTLNNISFAQAGNYTVTATNTITATNTTGTATSAPSTPVGVVDRNVPGLQVPIGGTLAFQVKAQAPTGSSFTFQWFRDSTALTNGPSAGGGLITGATSAKLSITKAVDADEGNYTCTVSMGAVSLTTLPAAAFAVIKPEVIAAASPPTGRVAQNYSWQPQATEQPTGFTISGLPPGLIYNKVTGMVSGIPTASGNPFNIKVTATNAAGTSLVRDFPMVINPLPTGSAGTFTALCAREPSVNSSMGGFITVTLAPSGSLTGTLINGALTHKFTGRVSLSALSSIPSSTIPIPRKDSTPLTLALTFDGTTLSLGGSVTDSGFTSTVSGKKLTFSGTAAAAYVTSGGYNCSLDLPSASLNDTAQPLGVAWQQIRVTASGTATATGRSPDGIAYTYSSALWPDGTLPHFNAIYAGGKGSITGQPRITLGTAAPDNINNRVVGTVSQQKTGPIEGRTYDRTYRSGIPALSREVDGSPWIKPTTTAPIVMSLPVGSTTQPNASVVFSKGGIDTALEAEDLDQNFVITTTNTTVFSNVSTGNSAKIALRLTPSTGLFTGSLSVTLSNGLGSAPSLRNVTCAGILLSHRTEGRGYFLLEGYHFNILGGRVIITAPPAMP